MSRKSFLYVALCGAILLGAGFLVGCSTEGKAAIGDTGQKVAAVGQQVSSEGWSEGNPVKGILGSILQILGGAGILVGGAGAVAKRAVKAHDEAPFAAEDVVSLDKARASMNAPTPPKA